jgi:hypothetical protein
MGRTLIALITGLAIAFTTFSTVRTVRVPVQQNHVVHHVLADNEGPMALVR